MRWAVARGDLDHNPFDGMKKPAGSTPRERALSDDEIRLVWNGLPTTLARSKACQRILKLCLVTAQRVGEVAGMVVSELDLRTATWTIPGTRTMNGHRHVAPLSTSAVGLIKEAIADAGEHAKYVFPNKDGKGPLSPLVVAKTVLRAQQARVCGRLRGAVSRARRGSAISSSPSVCCCSVWGARLVLLGTTSL